eukprot:2457840-Pleurochrysis_carterae.AAC.9
MLELKYTRYIRLQCHPFKHKQHTIYVGHHFPKSVQLPHRNSQFKPMPLELSRMFNARPSHHGLNPRVTVLELQTRTLFCAN